MASTKEISLMSTIIQNTKTIVSDMDGEKVMLSIEKGKYYNLGEVGGEIWELVKEPLCLEDLLQKLTTLYNVDPIICKEQVISFLNSLLKEELIRVE